MKVSPYKVEAINATRYEFESIGPKGVIKKGMEISALNHKNIFNVGFGDIREDGTIDDESETNNGDLIRVLATVIDIMEDFIAKYPSAILFFKGSTEQRTTVYQYILKRHFLRFNKQFNITGFLMMDGVPHEVAYDPTEDKTFLAFLIKKKQ